MSGVCEHAEMEHRATVRLCVATWTLALMTLALILATVGLAVVTAQEKAHHEPPAVTEVVANVK